MRFEHRWAVVVLLCTLTGVAQQPATDKNSDAAAEKPAYGTVSGRVFLDDTKGPARKATVYLQPVAALMADKPPDHNHGAAEGDATVGVQTRFEGGFSFSHVAAGSYYVIASYPGYLSPYVPLSLAEGRCQYGAWQPLGPSQQAAKELVLKSIPRITVQSNQSVTIDVPLERGAAISGNISYDDGSPAADLDVDVLARVNRDGKETWDVFKLSKHSLFSQIKTDDRGNYRISGLPARKYVVRVTLNLMRIITYSSGGTSTYGSGGNQLMIYSGSTLRLKDAASFAVYPGEERTGEDLWIPLSKLHTITGNIVSAYDGHVINSGQVDLYNTDDKSFAGSANLSQDDPGFTFNFIYEGEYMLMSPMSADVDYQLLPQQPGSSSSPPQYDGHALHLYGSASKPLHVDGDMDGVTIAVPEPTAEESRVFKDALRQQQNQSPAPQ
ncbi:MAG: carboxypeptidase-like regulatory domain-containing protein [Silvibacterium sp.]